ncbi:hypothetical protein SPRG_12655 [Saprolegnia parasitica CBS 223.65]|uniref:Polycystin cation channel PKD1/PKD2 domain-containing protein n=1 Tax=Saprolegnia parasitica (strain CBS 223.65) TaxID=695850 RepID=A0A067C5U4_SAPPC|nr:hypothetical protein SPRG_12655 [Saprolegnia parasitica CBS 223.65]KDO22157.1 hypothetical protein SPRG_12655 [Saprolegnia parasitica CBS 223.65]|eukprot:XP_012207097.1 hypothetical protein SPRG_12655 [Saprolegnia parasitica CBS 223.65]
MTLDYFEPATPRSESTSADASASIRVHTIGIALTARKQLRGHFLTLPVPLLLFVAFITMVLTHTPIQRVYMANHGVAMTLNPKVSDVAQSQKVVNFMKIRSLDDIPRWVNNSVLPALFTNTSMNGSPLPRELRGRVSSYHALVGAATFLTFNTNATDCQSASDIAANFGPCYDYDVEVAIDTPGPLSWRNMRFVPWNTLHIPVAHPDPYGRWQRWLKESAENNYGLSITTREFAVTITTYNGQLDLFTYQRFRIEVDEGGACNPSYKVQSIPTNPYATSHLHIALDAVVWLLVLYVLCRRVAALLRQIRGHIPWSCSLGIALIEWCSIASVALYYAAWFRICTKFFNSGLETQLRTLNSFYDDLYTLPLNANETTRLGQDNQRHRMESNPQPEVSDILDSFGGAIDIVYVVSIVACLQLAIHVLAAFQFHPTMNVLTNTIVTSIKRLGSFLFVFGLVVLSLATSGCLLFGPQLDEFSRLDKAMVTCVNMLYGGLSYELIKDVNDLAIVWFWASQSIVYMVLVNIMLAVVITSHQEIVAVNFGKRSFVDEFFLVVRDVIKIYLLRRPDLFKRLANRMPFEPHRDVWTADDVAATLGITYLRATRLIRKLQHYAASVDVDEPVVRPMALAARSAPCGHCHDMEAKMLAMDAKLAFLIEHITTKHLG